MTQSNEIYNLKKKSTILVGTNGNDTFYGYGTGEGEAPNSAADEVFLGRGGNDIIYAGAGKDRLFGDAGNDTLNGGSGADIINGGVGSDTVSYATSSAAVSVNLKTGKVSGGDAQGDKLLSIENVEGSQFADVLVGSKGHNVITGGGGDDTLTGGGGNDTFHVDSGSDTITDLNNGDILRVGEGAIAIANNVVRFVATDATVNANGTAIFNLVNGGASLDLSLANGWHDAPTQENEGPLTADGGTGLNANYISDGGDDAYDSGNRLSTQQENNFSYGGGDIVNGDADTGFGIGSRYATSLQNSIFAVNVENNASDTFALSGNLGSDSSTQYALGDFGAYRGFKAVVYQSGDGHSGDPTINRLLIVDSGATLSVTAYTDNGDDSESLLVSGLSDSSTLAYVVLYGQPAEEFVSGSILEAAFHNYVDQVIFAGGASVAALEDRLTSFDDNIATIPGDFDWYGNNSVGGQYAYEINGGTGNDTIVGSDLDDLLTGGAGNDRLTGGEGIDTFAMAFGTVDAVDTITDFSAGGGGDILDFTGAMDVNNPWIDFEGGGHGTLSNGFNVLTDVTCATGSAAEVEAALAASVYVTQNPNDVYYIALNVLDADSATVGSQAGAVILRFAESVEGQEIVAGELTQVLKLVGINVNDLGSNNLADFYWD